VKLVFFPKNTTAGTQPLDAGIIKNFKHYYRKYLLDYLFNEDDDADAAKKITVSLAIEWIKRSWNHCVKNETISNCWRKVGFTVVNDVQIVEEEEELVPEEIQDSTLRG
jgi:hypothetical protein